MRVCGIDPGKTGSAALYVTEPGQFYGVLADVIDIPLAEIEGLEVVDAPALVRRLQHWVPDRVWLERIWAMPSFPDPKTGERRQMGAATSFTFGDVFGTIRTTVVLDGWPMSFVTSPVWKLFFGLKGPDKEQSRLRAIELMPAAEPLLARKRDAGRAEAALIARYGAMMAWTDAGGAVPAAEVRQGQILYERLRDERAKRRRQRRQRRIDAEEIPE